MKETREIRFTRNGREQSMTVEMTWNTETFAWIKKVGNKPFFGHTGYYNMVRDATQIHSYRGKILAENVELIG